MCYTWKTIRAKIWNYSQQEQGKLDSKYAIIYHITVIADYSLLQPSEELTNDVSNERDSFSINLACKAIYINQYLNNQFLASSNGVKERLL